MWDRPTYSQPKKTAFVSDIKKFHLYYWETLRKLSFWKKCGGKLSFFSKKIIIYRKNKKESLKSKKSII